jgi:alanine dehydrogenase
LQELAKSLNVYQGEIVYKGVAEAFAEDNINLDEILNKWRN